MGSLVLQRTRKENTIVLILKVVNFCTKVTNSFSKPFLAVYKNNKKGLADEALEIALTLVIQDKPWYGKRLCLALSVCFRFLSSSGVRSHM